VAPTAAGRAPRAAGTAGAVGAAAGAATANGAAAAGAATGTAAPAGGGGAAVAPRGVITLPYTAVRVRVPHTPGDRVRVLDGPLAGVGGVLVRLRVGELALVRLSGEHDPRLLPLLELAWVLSYAEEDFL